MKKIITIILLFYAGFSYAQPTVLGTQTVNGGYTTYDLTSRGGARFVRMQASSSVSSGARNWEFATGTSGSTNYSINWRPYSVGQTLSGYNTRIDPSSATASARYNTGSGGQSGLMPAITSGRYYTFIVGNNSASNNFMSVLETSYNPTTISTVTRNLTTVNNNQTVTLTVTLANAKNASEKVFVRWSTDGFNSNNTFTEIATFNGSFQGTATIPAQSNGTTITYYVLSTEQTTPSATDIDFLTLNLNNNSNSNYSYTVNTTSWETAAAGNFSSAATWATASTVPTSTSIVTIKNNVTLDQAVTIASLTINNGATFTASDNIPRTLTINSAASNSVQSTLTNNGTWANGTGGSTVVFTGAPTGGDLTHSITGAIGFNNLTMNKTGGASNVGIRFATGQTLTGVLEVGSGGYVETDVANFYGAASTIRFNQGSANYDVNNNDKTWPNNNPAPNIVIASATVTLNTPRYVTAGGTLTVASGATLASAGNLTVRSDATGTARIANSAGTISGNITIERYVPAKSARKWSFVASPVQATVRNAWQSQVFITGVGTGGTACGTGSGNGGGSDKYNTNGFDVSLGNAASLMQYNATQVSGSRWVSVANTSTNLVPGKGYRMNIRGARGASDANCANQISSATPTAPAAVTLSATGIYPTGSALQATVFGTTATGGSNAFTLLGNPFPSELSFSAVQAANTTIGRKIWMYVGSNVGYSSWNNGTISGTWPAGYQTGSDVTIPSGSAFFVENTNSADATVTFAEAHKEATVIANGNTFQSRNTQTQNAWNLVRATLQETNGNYFDDCVIRFGTNAGIDNNNYTGFDGVSLNTGNSQYIASYKSGVSSVLTFNTRSQNYTNDTVKLFVKNTMNGTSQLKFTEHLSMPGDIILRDKFTNTTQDIKANALYNFDVTADPLSQGGERFEIVFRSASTLPVQFVTVNAEKKVTGAQVNFTVAKDEEAKNYVVERSNGNANFTAVANIDSKNQTGNVSYTALDNQSIQGTVLYRVKANSKNGGYVYSPTVKLAGDKGAVQLTLYPNPVKETLNIQTEGTVAGKVSIRIVNQIGEVMQTLNNVVISNSQVNMNVAKLPAGVYHVSISNGADYHAKGSFVK